MTLSPLPAVWAVACNLALGIAAASSAGSICWAAPAEVSDVIKAAEPYGQGKYSVLLSTAYSAALWTDAKEWSMQDPFALTLTYDMSFSTDEMVSRSRNEMKHVDPDLTEAELQAYDVKLTEAFPPVKSGDRITALYQPGGPARFYRNGDLTATIADPKLNADFFGIWLSPKSSAPSLRAALVHKPERGNTGATLQP